MAPKSPNVEAFLVGLEHQRKPEVEALRQAILEGVPGLTERIKWNAPSFGPGNEDRITMRLQPGDRLELVLHRGAKARTIDGFTFADPAALIAWATADRGVITLAPGQLDQDRKALADVLRRWVAATT